MTISAKLFSIQTTSFRGEDLLCFLNRCIRKTGHAPGGHVLTDKICFSYSTPNEDLPYFTLVSVSPPCVSPSHGGFMVTATVNSR